MGQKTLLTGPKYSLLQMLQQNFFEEDAIKLSYKYGLLIHYLSKLKRMQNQQDFYYYIFPAILTVARQK